MAGRGGRRPSCSRPAPTRRRGAARGIPVYGVYPYPIAHADLQAMHGNDERIAIASLEQGTDMLTRVVREAVG